MAGGLSSRVGRDKARLRLGGRTFLTRIRRIAATAGFPVRVIRRDLVPRCGPLGGIYTALKTSRHDQVLFVACDMPCINGQVLRRLISAARTRSAVFTAGPDGAGFPFLLRRDHLPLVEQSIALRAYSLQAFAQTCRARRLRVAARHLININTPEDLAALSSRWFERIMSR